MLDLAKHIVNQKTSTFEPEKFEDHYEAALTELINQKRNGKPIAASRISFFIWSLPSKGGGTFLRSSNDRICKTLRLVKSIIGCDRSRYRGMKIDLDLTPQGNHALSGTQ